MAIRRIVLIPGKMGRRPREGGGRGWFTQQCRNGPLAAPAFAGATIQETALLTPKPPSAPRSKTSVLIYLADLASSA